MKTAVLQRLRWPVACAVLVTAMAAMTGGAGAAEQEPNAVFGVLSDVHLVPADAKSVEKFKKTLRYLDSRKVDGVVICGDLTHRGSIPSLMGFGRVWREVFPGDRRSDGGHVERLFVYGDHETENMYCSVYTNAWTREGCMEEMRVLDIYSNDRALQWKRAFGDDYHPIERKRVKGYDFVLAHIVMGDEPGLRWGEPLYIPGLEEFFATNAFDRTRPFFYVQHKIPRGTVGGEKIWGQDDGRTTKLLSKYPNAVAFCGHKHRGATEERLFWQGAFTAFMVPAHMGVGTEEGHENGVCSGDRPSHTPQLQMSRIDTRDGSQGFVMSLYDNRIVIERREFAKGGEVAPPWVVPIPNDGSMSFEARAARAAVPQFAKGTEVTVREIHGKNRSGRATDQLSVEFPPINGGRGLPRAYDYEVTAILKKAYVRRIVGSKRVFSPKCHLAPEHDTGPVVCLFGKEELPSDHDTLEFEVVPANAFGARGEPIRSEPRSFNPTPCATTLW